MPRKAHCRPDEVEGRRDGHALGRASVRHRPGADTSGDSCKSWTSLFR